MEVQSKTNQKFEWLFTQMVEESKEMKSQITKLTGALVVQERGKFPSQAQSNQKGQHMEQTSWGVCCQYFCIIYLFLYFVWCVLCDLCAFIFSLILCDFIFVCVLENQFRMLSLVPMFIIQVFSFPVFFILHIFLDIEDTVDFGLGVVSIFMREINFCLVVILGQNFCKD